MSYIVLLYRMVQNINIIKLPVPVKVWGKDGNIEKNNWNIETGTSRKNNGNIEKNIENGNIENNTSIPVMLLGA